MADRDEEDIEKAHTGEKNTEFQSDQKNTDSGFDPEIDLLNRYNNMLETQMDSINEIDNKASDTARLIGILFGLILTAGSLGATTEFIEFSEASVPFFVMFAFSIGMILLALVLSIITYLSSTIIHGPTASVGGYIANYRVEPQQYIDIMLRTYSRAVRENKNVIFENASRFKNALAVLISGLIYLLATGILLVATALEVGSYMQWGIAVVFTLAGIVTAYGLGIKDYITIEAEHLVKNDE